jgi:hypothetical protein
MVIHDRQRTEKCYRRMRLTETGDGILAVDLDEIHTARKGMAG